MVKSPKWALEGRQAKVSTIPRSSMPGRRQRRHKTCRMNSSSKQNVQLSQKRTSYFGEGYVLDHNFCACLRAVIPSCECCCSPFFCEVVARVHWHKSQFNAYTINVWLKKLLSSVVSSRTTTRHSHTGTPTPAHTHTHTSTPHARGRPHPEVGFVFFCFASFHFFEFGTMHVVVSNFEFFLFCVMCFFLFEFLAMTKCKKKLKTKIPVGISERLTF